MAKDDYTLYFCYFITCIKASNIRKCDLNPNIHNPMKLCVMNSLTDELCSVLDAPDGSDWSPLGFSLAWLRIFSAAWCLPMDPPCPSGLGEEQVNVGQLFKPVSPHSHVKLPALQLIPVIHLRPLVRVETAAQHKQSVFLSKPKQSLVLRPWPIVFFF